MNENKDLRGPIIGGPIIRGEESINGKSIKLTRGGKEVRGVIISQSGQNEQENFVFKWKDGEGKQCVSPIDGDELAIIKDELNPY